MVSGIQENEFKCLLKYLLNEAKWWREIPVFYHLLLSINKVKVMSVSIRFEQIFMVPKNVRFSREHASYDILHIKTSRMSRAG